jgi:MerR family transcriptional regulator, redox-sensitive transcriptional activator SoxR
MEPLPIGEVARRAGIAQSAIRYYEAAGLLSDPARSSGGWRVFPPEVVDQLKVIRTARELGFSLEDIRVLINGVSPDTPPSLRWQQLAERKLPEVDLLIERATAMKRLLEKGLRCDCVSIQDCIRYDCNPPVSLGRRGQGSSIASR